jgi:hypothetical protein
MPATIQPLLYSAKAVPTVGCGPGTGEAPAGRASGPTTRGERLGWLFEVEFEFGFAGA